MTARSSRSNDPLLSFFELYEHMAGHFPNPDRTITLREAYNWVSWLAAQPIEAAVVSDLEAHPKFGTLPPATLLELGYSLALLRMMSLIHMTPEAWAKWQEENPPPDPGPSIEDEPDEVMPPDYPPTIH